MPKVSIVLPVYNGEKYLKKSIDSILNQSFNDFELIIVNDCSTDSTVDILNSYNDDRIRIINNETNQKLPKSLNIGFKHSIGEYLTWTSDDNIFHKTALEKMVNIIGHKTDVGFVYCDYRQIDENGEFIRNMNLSEPEMIWRGNCVGACFLYKKEVKDIVGDYDPSMILVEDYDYWMRVSFKTKMYHIKEVLYDYRIHNNSLTNKYQSDVMSQTSSMWYKYFSTIIGNIHEQKQRFEFYDNIINFEKHNDIKKVIKLLSPKDKSYIWRAYGIKVSRLKTRIFTHFKRKE